MKDLGEKKKITFTFRQTLAITKAKWNLERKDMVINYITKETMLVDNESGKPWRGPREKDARFLQFFIEGCFDEEDVVLDYTAATSLFMPWIDNSKRNYLFDCRINGGLSSNVLVLHVHRLPHVVAQDAIFWR